MNKKRWKWNSVDITQLLKVTENAAAKKLCLYRYWQVFVALVDLDSSICVFELQRELAALSSYIARLHYIPIDTPFAFFIVQYAVA